MRLTRKCLLTDYYIENVRSIYCEYSRTDTSFCNAIRYNNNERNVSSDVILERMPRGLLIMCKNHYFSISIRAEL